MRFIKQNNVKNVAKAFWYKSLKMGGETFSVGELCKLLVGVVILIYMFALVGCTLKYEMSGEQFLEEVQNSKSFGFEVPASWVQIYATPESLIDEAISRTERILRVNKGDTIRGKSHVQMYNDMLLQWAELMVFEEDYDQRNKVAYALYTGAHSQKKSSIEKVYRILKDADTTKGE